MTIRPLLSVLMLAAATALPAQADNLSPLLSQLVAALPPAATLDARLAPIAPKSAALTDVSDVWWNAGESGWGLQLVQNDTVVFATVYLYAADGRPSHYTATLFHSGNLVWAGNANKGTNANA